MEKVDLFFGIMVALILALIPAALLLRDQLERRRKTGKRVKALKATYNLVYWLAVLLFLLVGGREVIGYFNKKNANEHTHNVETANTADHDTLKKDADTIKANVREIPALIGSSTDTILKSMGVPKSDKISPAELIMCPAIPPNIYPAILQSTNNPDSFQLRLCILNHGSYTAFGLHDSLFHMSLSDGNVDIPDPPISAFLPDQLIHFNEAWNLDYSEPHLKRPDSGFVFIKVHYTDSSRKNGLLRAIYRICPFIPNASFIILP